MKNTTALKNFATSSRTALIEQMRGRAKQVLDDPTAAVEYSHDVRALRDAVAEHGIDWVADTAAYTWFNRLTAARFMDANGFSGPFGVVSPAAGSASAFPEILTRAQAGEFPDEIPSHVQASVMDLLTGKRTSADPDGEAYALLLGAVFASWYKPMPEVFPAAVDWIRLLTPLNMLAPTSVRAIAVAEMDAEACKNVEVVGWLYQFYIAELKAAINDSNVSIDAAQLPAVTQLFTPEYIVRYLVQNSLGRLWLRSRPTSGLREHMEYYIEHVAGQEDTGVTVSSPEEIKVLDPACGSGHMLTYAFDLMFRIYEEEGYTPASIPQLILTNNLRGLEIDERAAQLASFALAMKAREKDRRFFTRRGDGDQPVQPDIVRVTQLEFDEVEAELITGAVAPEKRSELARLVHSFKDADTFGSLIRVDPDSLDLLAFAIRGYEEPGSQKDLGSEIEFKLMLKAQILGKQGRALANNQYHVVVANPPYLGSGNMGSVLSSFAKKQYPDTKSDLYAMFIERNSEFSVHRGSVAMVTRDSWMFISSYKRFRPNLPSWGHLSSMAHLGTRGFDTISGDVVQATAFVIDIEDRPNAAGTFLRLVNGRSESAKSSALREALIGRNFGIIYVVDMSFFDVLPEYVIAYWISDRVRTTFRDSPRLGKISAVRCGMNTGDNASFVRFWWEPSRVSIVDGADSEESFRAASGGWCPYNKGGDARRWWGNQSSVLKYDRESTAILEQQGNRLPSRGLYFDSSISWSKIGGATFRKYPNGFIFDGGGMSVFSEGIDDWKSIAGFLNSSTSVAFLGALAPTVNVQSGDVANLPVAFDFSRPPAGIDEAVSLFRADWDDYEGSWDFKTNPLVARGCGSLEMHSKRRWADALANTKRAQELEVANNRHFASTYGLEDEVECGVARCRITLTQNPYFRYEPKEGFTRTDDEYRTLFDLDLAREIISYAVGCIMGRYSLDKPGLILADAGATIADFEAKVPNARFRPDADGIIPITAEHYFQDDIVARIEEFLAVALGKENVNANLEWLEFALGSGNRKSLRDYFLKDFYNDHVKTFSKRPIYWQVSSNSKTDKGFNALFYVHRYSPTTLGIVRENYANEMTDKQQARLETIEHALPTAGKAEATKLSKERDQLTTQRREIRDWITNKLFPLSTAEVKLDLDDGVKRNYTRLADVLRKVSGL